MKHVTILSCREVSLESMDLSGFNIAVESHWSDFKKFIGFSDEAKVEQRLKELESCSKDLKMLKSKVSSSNKNDAVSVNITKAITQLPVKGDTGAEIVKGLTKLRQEFEKSLKKVEQIKTKEDLDAIKAELKELSGQKYPVPEKIRFTRSDLLKIFDETIQINDIEIEVIKKGMKLKTENVSTESYAESLENLALESFFDKVAAVILGLLGLWATYQSIGLLMITLMFVTLGAWSFAVGFGVFSFLGLMASKFLIQQAVRFWKKEE